MEVKVVKGIKKTEMLGIFMTEERAKRVKAGKEKTYKPVADAIKAGDFSGKADQKVRVSGEGVAKRIVLVGMGKDKNAEAVRRAASIAAGEAAELELKELSFMADVGVKGEAAAAAEGAVLGLYDFDKYKKERKKRPQALNIIFHGDTKAAASEACKACIAAEGACMARDWVNESSDVLNPVTAAEMAKRLAEKHGIRCNVFDEGALRKMGMNLMLSVASGSRFPPRLVVLEYMKGKGKPVVLVGKGVTFDSGGLNLKPWGFIETMKLDKAGAMTVLATVVTLARLKAKVNVVAVLPLVENMIGPNASKPGNIIKSYSGKTVEIADTDAEGRLILADALAYAGKQYKPRLIIDLATLTGAALVIFGEYVAPLLSTDEKEAEALFNAGERMYERVWELPIYKEYEEEMKGEISDLRNLGYKQGRYAGTITAAAFLKQFIGKVQWVHVDIAGTAWYEKGRYYIPKGGTGFGVRLLVEYLTAKGEGAHRVPHVG